jgi:hypothetical protein
MFDMVTGFCYSYRRVDPLRLYLVEDVHVAYKDRFGDGLRRNGSSIGFGEGPFDEREIETVGTGGVKATEFTGTTLGISFYHSVVTSGRRSTTHGHFVKSGPNVEPR